MINSILVGEIAYNLRSALDYLVYELARHDAGKVVDMTQFPIESLETGFERQRKRHLKGVNDEHIAGIKRLQPFEGIEWTSALRDISNPDKHRHLTAVATPVVLSVSTDDSGKDITGDISIEIMIGGLPAVPVLGQLIIEVAGVLDSFSSELATVDE